ncbi:Spore germination protein GerE [Pelagimonas phthalicica]|uniref:Spore germination protein GerE n=1 Tax=Pelagimonas phthalicica TaxID=1037362 RepID=A0A238JA35_9RHOB|nr:LuxR family transcriptional regulator [Pelagimonas phthalicica]TDS94016.1 RNA polymerase sigma factor (sigma-70 family) [Pelagimonas phthalicica]SMX27459.1 Spore germination protein GerE [Pelagimonas phthalicica]
MAQDRLMVLAQRLETVPDLDRFWQLFEDGMTSVGITRFIYLSLSGDDLYMEANIDLSAAIPDGYRDPFLDYCCNSYAVTRTGAEFLSDYAYLGAQERRLIELAAQNGFRAGLGIPVRVKGSARYGGFNLGTGLSREKFEAQILPHEAAFQTFCMVAHRKLEDLIDREAEPKLPQGLEVLSTREREVFLLFAKGKTRSECADTLGISHHTVSTHLKNSYEKLGLKNKAEAARFLALGN